MAAGYLGTAGAMGCPKADQETLIKVNPWPDSAAQAQLHRVESFRRTPAAGRVTRPRPPEKKVGGGMGEQPGSGARAGIVHGLESAPAGRV